MGKTHGTSLSQRGNRSTYDYSDIFSGFETDNSGSLLYNDASNDINILASHIKSSRGRRLSNSSAWEHECEREHERERQQHGWEELEREQPEPTKAPTPTKTLKTKTPNISSSASASSLSPFLLGIRRPLRSRSADPSQTQTRARTRARTRTRGRDSSLRGRDRATARSCSPSNIRTRPYYHTADAATATSRSMSPSERNRFYINTNINTPPTTNNNTISSSNNNINESAAAAATPAEQRDDTNSNDNTDRGGGNASRRSSSSSSNRYRLGKEMIVLADGINLDRNTRLLLAAYDARTLDDFYLMADIDFIDLLRKAKAANNSLSPLQIRKVRMLRRWLKDLVDENMMGDDNEYDDELSCSSSRKKRIRQRERQRRRLVPKDWANQYKHDLPHLKLQLRQQGDSLLERFSMFGSVLSIAVAGCGTSTGYY